MLKNEMSIQDELQDCASIRDVDGLDLLHLCLDNLSESQWLATFKEKLWRGKS